ncbi:uncharacterized protein LOC114538010 [Dendronephthya gigantea]|uniref:uncharacterized protein LOC114538010 n=1 Tax=Dendronephthya gigantea TaxID=151771 RepID=UPI00106A957D|nr:uncharacterized protein LOC114538010 [Dendronephthya gigantea]
MSGLPWESEESQNYIRAEYIVTDAVRKELRDFFIQEWNKRYQASLGAWDDTNVSGSQLSNLEKKRRRPNKTMLQSKFQNGNTNEWDCTVLFDAILYSKSIGCSLSTTEKTEIDILRKLRNEITHNVPDKTLTNKDFQTMTTKVENALGALGLSINEVVRIKTLFSSFIILPPEPAHEVVYRSDEINEIREGLEKLRSDNDGKLTYLYISGNPGSGKSQLARQVCEDIHAKDEAVFVMTLNGKDLDSLLHSYEDFCRRLNCIESALQIVSSSCKPEEEKIKDLRSQISCRIKNWKKWWIIVDNVENLELISPLLPLKGDEVWKDGQVILTTQNTNAVPQDSTSTKHISLIHGMNDQECRQLLVLLSCTEVNDPLLDEMAEKLDRQPLAMAAGAVYMREVTNSCPDFSWRDYLRKLENGKRGLTEERLRQMNSAAYSSTMSTAVLLAVRKCAENNTILEHAFNLFSLISFEPLPLDLVVKYIQEQQEVDAEHVITAIKLSSLFVQDASNGDVRLHRVVHEAVKTFCLFDKSEKDNTENKSTSKEENITHIYRVVKIMSYFSEREDKIKSIPHLKAFHKEIIDNIHFPDQALYLLSLRFEKADISQMYLSLGSTLYRFCQYELSMEFLQLALKIQLNHHGPNHIYVANLYSNLGVLCSVKGDLDQANEYYQQALKIKLEQLGPNHTDVASLYNNLSNVCSRKGDLDQANEYCQQALKIKLEQLGPNHTDVAISYNSLGNVCSRKGDLDQANEYFQRALKIKLEQLGPNHTDVATSYNSLGNVCSSKGDFDQANEYYQRALKIQLEQLGPNHTDVAASYNNLGNVCSNKGDFDQANEYYQRALKIKLEQLGPNHTDVATSYNSLGNVCSRKGDLDQANEYYQRALKIQLEQLGPNHTNVATSYNNLGIVCSRQGDLDQANEYYQRALKIQLEQLGPNHTDVATSYNSLGNVCSRKGDLDQANEYYQRALKIQLEQLGPNHTNVATSYNNLGIVCSRKGDLDQANEYYQRALKIQLEQLGPNHTDVATSYHSLGYV